jgi:hypothetical protein
MSKAYKPIDLTDLQTRSVHQRRHKASVTALAGLPPAGASAAQLLAALPDTLGAASFRRVVDAIVDARQNDRPVVAAFGAHVIKVGCGPVLIDLIRRGVISAIACNGACAIHDAELATIGETSEEVEATIRDGSFGMVAETLSLFQAITARAQKDRIGLGRAVALELLEVRPPHADQSVFLAAHQASIPACVHVAIGTDTVHVAPGLDAAALGAASMMDFRLICDVVRDLGAKPGGVAGGVWLNIGSSVVLPEVFLKAVAVARNLGANLDAMSSANFDMLRHYRPHVNVVTRPVSKGRGHEVIGHHEILLPLLRQAIIERLG